MPLTFAVESLPVDFDEASHVYRVHGVVVPSVTQILQASGLTQSFSFDAATRDLAADRGTLVHLACEYLDRGVLRWETLDPILTPFVRAYEAFKAETGFRPRLTEHRGAARLTLDTGEHATYGFCLDREGTWRGADGKLLERAVLADLKTGKEVKPAVGVQLGGYELGLNAPRDRDRIAVQLRPDTRKGAGKPYRVFQFPDERATFRWALGIAHWKLGKKAALTSGVDELTLDAG